MKMIEYRPNVEIKKFDVLIDGKSFFDTLIKKKNHLKRLLKWEEIMIIQQVTY